MSRNIFRATAVALAVGMAGIAACDRSPVDPPGHNQLGEVVIIDRTVTPRVTLATWTHTTGWDTDLLTTLSHATDEDHTRISLGVEMWTQGGQAITLVEGGAYEAQYGVIDPDDIINMDPALGLFHGDHVHVYGYDDGRTGEAQLVFALWHGNHDDGVTTPIRIVITD
jgi:hypothetical protein